MEKRLRRDLKRTHALLADVQLLLETSGADPGPSGSQEEWAKLHSQVRGGASGKRLSGQAVAGGPLAFAWTASASRSGINPKLELKAPGFASFFQHNRSREGGSADLC